MLTWGGDGAGGRSGTFDHMPPLGPSKVFGRLQRAYMRSDMCTQHTGCIVRIQANCNTPLMLQAVERDPLLLSLQLSWNKYYQTKALHTAVEHTVINLQQTPKSRGRDHDTCYIAISRLHPSIDGLQQVDKVDFEQNRLAIRAPLYNDTEIDEIRRAISTQQPTVQKRHQVKPSLVLNELTVTQCYGWDADGNKLDQETVASILAGIGALSHPLTLSEQATPTLNLHSLPILPSTVIDEWPASDHGDNAFSAGLDIQVL